MTSMPAMTVPEFVAKWAASQQTERSASQEHFLNLCDLLGHRTPNTDATGEAFAFEKGTAKVGGGEGFADVWKRGFFAWEYKKRRRNLQAAYAQLLQYREDLENPPLLVVCDLDRFEVHTNFTGTVKRVYAFDLSDLAANQPTGTCRLPPLDVLRSVFFEPGRLGPRETPAQVTERAAGEFAALATSLRARGADPERAAHFLMRLLFCLFAEDTGLLPPRLFTRLVEQTRARPQAFGDRIRPLFAAMATGGFFGTDDIAHFDGGLFADDTVLDLTTADLDVLGRAGQLDWASVEPAIFGTLFERSLDPAKRAQLGAHYTSREDILLIVEPVLMAPLRRRWEEVREQARELIAKRDTTMGAARTRHQQALQRLLIDFSGELARERVLDPACGSGNFLYTALKELLDLEKGVITFAATHGVGAFIPQVGPEQLYGIEVNAYAHELAQVVVWIGYIQWLHDNGFGAPADPILKPLTNIRQMDAILTYDEGGCSVEPSWPRADVIVGNPPFLGDKKMRAELGDGYVDQLRTLYAGRVPGGADLVTYWFERARELIAGGDVQRAGLLATQGIRGGANRRVLDRIKQTGDIFMAWSDRNWILDGAAVHVSIVGFDGGYETERRLDGVPVTSINARLQGDLDLTQAGPLEENADITFVGGMKKGHFELTGTAAREMLAAPVNPNGRPNSDVLRPWLNGLDVTRRARDMWIIDFGEDRSEEDAALYERPFEYVRQHVKPDRDKVRSRLERERWWLHARPAPDLRAAVRGLSRFIVTPRVAKHRLFVFMDAAALPDGQLVVIARDDPYILGVLQSKVHELWARRMGTQVREAESGFRYSPTMTFETFPFPWPPGEEPAGDPRVVAVAEAAGALVEKRDLWLAPPGATEAQLAERTLTKLYNDRPTWLVQAHERLDGAVLDAYDWPHDLPDTEILERLLALNLERAAPLPSSVEAVA
jgi:type II restriction/modification system DNA methylase subunit YeeA